MKRLTWESGPQWRSAATAPSVEMRSGSGNGLPQLKIAGLWLAVWIALSLLALPAIQQQGQVPMFFRAGLSVALILWAGARHIPMVLVVWVVSLSVVSQFPSTSPELTVARAAALVGPYALGCMALRQMPFDLQLRRLRDVVLFLGVGVLLPAIPSALAAQAMGFSILERTLPSVVSILSVTPFLLTNVIPHLERRWGLGGRRSVSRTVWHSSPAVIFGATAVIGGLMWVANRAEQSANINLYFLCFLPIAWVAMRYGMAITTGVIFTTAMAVAVLQVFAWPEEVVTNSRLATLFFSAAGIVMAAIEEGRKQQADLIQRLASVADKSGSSFFRAVCAHMSEALESDYTLVCEMITPTRVRTLAVCADGRAAEPFVYDLAGTPCEGVATGAVCAYAGRLQAQFPDDHMLADIGAESYVGTPLRSSTGECLGLIAVIYRQPLDSTKWIEAGLAAFASRTGAELERLRNEESIRFSEQRYRALVQNSRESIWCIEFEPPVPVNLPEEELLQRMLENGYLADINEFGARMRGFKSAEDWLGTRLKELVRRDAAPMETLRQVIRDQFQFTQGVFAVHSEGKGLMHLQRSAFGVVEDGLLRRLWGTAQDVTELVRAKEEIQQLNAGLEDQVARRTLDLRAAVKELEAFSYSASHDLRAPLLGILGSARVLEEDYRAALGAGGKEWLDRLTEDASYMDRLLDAMLGLSRVSRADVLWREVDLGEIAQTVVANLRGREPGRRVEFTASQDLRVRGDPDLLRGVMENLIGNAWKFTRDRETPRIELGAMQRNSTRAYFVRDNGAGFDPQYASRLFTAFQRLHGKEFEGTGIGLATVQRVIHRHGGEVWAEGAPGEGATFYFTLDKEAHGQS